MYTYEEYIRPSIVLPALAHPNYYLDVQKKIQKVPAHIFNVVQRYEPQDVFWETNAKLKKVVKVWTFKVMHMLKKIVLLNGYGRKGLRESDMRFSTHVFFHKSVSPRPLGPLRILCKFAEIFTTVCLSPVSLLQVKN